MTAMEMLRLALLYVHLIACCAALGLILKSDALMARQLWRNPAAMRFQADDLHDLKTLVSRALLVLWATGVTLIWLDVTQNGWIVFSNPKLQAKIVVVLLLSANGWLLHHLVLPACVQGGSLLHLPPVHYRLAIGVGAMSAVSWLYAALLGAGHALSWKYSLLQLLLAYPVLIVAATATLLLLLRRHRSSMADAAPASAQPATPS